MYDTSEILLNIGKLILFLRFAHYQILTASKSGFTTISPEKNIARPFFLILHQV